MISNKRIFFISILSPIIESILFIFYFAVIGYVKIILEEKGIILPVYVLNLWISLYLLYLLISNTIIPSICGLLFNFKFHSKHKTFIMFSNLIWYGSFCSIVFLQIIHSQSIYYYFFIGIYVMDLLGCFIKKINTRFVYYFMNIKVLERKNKIL